MHPLALIMLLIVPVVVIFIAIISCFIRKASKQSGHSFGLAGALATEVLAGIKTVASLCAEPWAISTYGEHVLEAQKSSVWAGFLTALSTGITSLLFYITYMYTFAFSSRIPRWVPWSLGPCRQCVSAFGAKCMVVVDLA